jgi:hypothetical protein
MTVYGEVPSAELEADRTFSLSELVAAESMKSFAGRTTQASY